MGGGPVVRHGHGKTGGGQTAPVGQHLAGMHIGSWVNAAVGIPH